jgi:ribulose-5-phosphate 4-epimerase/fuculose-1-phosphate aldolase
LPRQGETAVKSISAKCRKEFLEACHAAAARGLMRCSSGNMSWRVDDERMLVTTTRSRMSRMTPDDIAVCAIRNGSVLNGKKPTVEINFHAGILRARV